MEACDVVRIKATREVKIYQDETGRIELSSDYNQA
jgi:hypothetical protein